jgi:rod shape-determining protein MreC
VLDIRRRTGVLLFVITMGHIFLISVQVQSKSGVPVLQAVTFGAFARVQGGTSSVIHGVRDFWGNYVGLRGVRAENETLRKQVADLEVRLQEQRALASRSTRLQELMNLQTSTTLPTIAADVIAGNPNPGMRTITIGRGSADGVRKDIALTERTRAGGMVVGVDGDPPFTMELVSNLADVKAGDTVVASGVDGIYPKGFTIGHVEAADRGAALYRVITVRPSVDFSSLEEVLVVLVPARLAIADDGGGATGGPAGTAK